MAERAQTVRHRPALLRALGPRDPPDEIEVEGRTHVLRRVMKHDSWAATAIYGDRSGRNIVAKFNRIEPVFIPPMRWVGRVLARRERAFLRRLAHLAQVPDELGPVTVGGKPLRHALARTYIEGSPFTDASKVDAAFFEQLRGLLDAIHAAGVAYVDLHKRENVLIDLNGRPHLVDFQVSFAARGIMARTLLRHLQEMDGYHLRKHHARTLPATLSPEMLESYLTPPAFIQAHRRVAAPLRTLRRRLLTWMKVRDRTGKAESELEPEDAFRREPEPPGAA
jgi:hypothetical protein